MSTHERAARVAELRELRRMADELRAQITAIENELKAEMDKLKTDTMQGPDYKITWKPVSSRRFDSRAFQAAYALLYEAFSRPTTARRFVLV